MRVTYFIAAVLAAILILTGVFVLFIQAWMYSPIAGGIACMIAGAFMLMLVSVGNIIENEMDK